MFKYLRTPQNLRRCCITATAAVLFIATSAPWAAAAPVGFKNRRLWIAREPEDLTSYVEYYVGDDKKPLKEIVWEKGRDSGKAVSLNGNSQQLELRYNQLQMHTLTIAGWFYWRGAARGMDEDSIHRQRFFTLSRDDNIWISLMPHAKNPDVKDENGNILNGIYMGFSMGTAKKKFFHEFWNPASDGVSYGIPLNEWHHIALTTNSKHVRLYIDGRLWFERMIILGVEEMRNNTLSIGGGRWNDPTLNALVDDLAIYSFAMNQDQIAMLNAGIDPLAEGASLPKPTEPSLPKPPTQTPQTITQNSGTLLGLPSISVYLAGGLIALFAALTFFVNAYKPKGGSGNRSTGKGGGHS